MDDKNKLKTEIRKHLDYLKSIGYPVGVMGMLFGKSRHFAKNLLNGKNCRYSLETHKNFEKFLREYADKKRGEKNG